MTGTLAAAFLVAAPLSSALALAIPARAEAPPGAQGVPCAQAAAIREHLSAAYHEGLAARGLSTNGRVLELFAASGGETWTLLSVGPRGDGCVAGAGTDLEVLVQPGKRS